MKKKGILKGVIFMLLGILMTTIVIDSKSIVQAKDNKYDILIKSANVYKKGNNLDMAIKDGVIVAVAPNIKGSAKVEIDGKGKLISPGFLDTHTHFSKTNMEGYENSKTLQEAVAASEKYMAGITDSEAIKADVKKRAEKTILMMIENGTTGVRTNIDWCVEAIEAIHHLKVKYKDYIDIQIATSITDEKIIIPAIEKGWVNVIGGYAQPEWNSIENGDVDRAFNLAKKYNLPLDMHIDESDDANIDTLKHVVDKTVKMGMQGKVTFGHITALSAVDNETAAKVIKDIAAAKINITSLPSCNMYLMGRYDTGLIRRGPTRIDELLKAGVNVSYASDNIRDPFRPFGNGDMLEEGLLTAQIIQYGTYTDLEKVYDMGTFNPSKVMGYTNYGLNVGNNADLVILDAPSAAEALIQQSTKLYVIKKGKVIVKNTKSSVILDSQTSEPLKTSSNNLIKAA